MLEYYLIERTEEYAKYKIIPDGELRPGYVIFYSNGKREVLEDSPDDVKRYYAIHALSGIDLSEDEGIVAWY